jgi:hypothetical protein
VHHLRHFATPDSRGNDEAQVWVFSKDEADGDERLTNVNKICAKRYLYSAVSESRERSWDLEAKLESLESTLGGLWPSVLAREDQVIE